MNRAFESGDLPRERLREKGAALLGDDELVAIIIGTGTTNMGVLELARQLLSEVGGVNKLSSSSVGGLTRVTGMGNAKAARLLAAVELGIRAVERRATDRGKRLTCSKDIYNRYATRLALLPQEVFFVVGLNERNEVIKEQTVAVGSISECRVGPREVFRPLIADACAKMVVLHNHPSGDPSPSPDDVAVTKRLASVGTLVDIPLLDHLVIGAGTYVSLRDVGLM